MTGHKTLGDKVYKTKPQMLTVQVAEVAGHKTLADKVDKTKPKLLTVQGAEVAGHKPLADKEVDKTKPQIVTLTVQVAEAAGLKHVPLPDFDGDFRDQKIILD